MNSQSLGNGSQGDRGEVVPGTQPGAPAELNLKRKFLITTGVTVVVWAVVAGIIVSELITVCDIDWFDRGNCPAPDG